MRGFQAALDAGAEAIRTMDCDFSHDPAVIPELVADLDEADLAIGSRYVAGGRIDGWGLHRRALSRTANTFAHLLLRLPVADCTSDRLIIDLRESAGGDVEMVKVLSSYLFAERTHLVSSIGANPNVASKGRGRLPMMTPAVLPDRAGTREPRMMHFAAGGLPREG